MEQSSNFPHAYVGGLGLYKGQPFVTGSSGVAPNKKTEIMNIYGMKQWIGAADYPYNSGDR